MLGWLIADTQVSSAVQLAWISENIGRPFADVEGQGDLSGRARNCRSSLILKALGVSVFEPCCTRVEQFVTTKALFHSVNMTYSYSQGFETDTDCSCKRTYIVRIESDSRNFVRIELLWEIQMLFGCI